MATLKSKYRKIYQTMDMDELRFLCEEEKLPGFTEDATKVWMVDALAVRAVESSNKDLVDAIDEINTGENPTVH